MNRWEIESAAQRHQCHYVLGPATRFLKRFMDLIDCSSDGWAYWKPPLLAAKRLMVMINKPETATEEEFKKALTPVKSFCTRHKFKLPEIV